MVPKFKETVTVVISDETTEIASYSSDHPAGGLTLSNGNWEILSASQGTLSAKTYKMKVIHSYFSGAVTTPPLSSKSSDDVDLIITTPDAVGLYYIVG
jgi:hypothetical protein